MKNSKWEKKTRTVNCVHGLVVLKHFHCSANLCLLFNIIPSVETFTQRAETGTNRTLLSICDLPTPHPPSECIATMEKRKGEGGRLPRYSGSYWWYTSSRIEDWVQRTDVRKRATCMQDILKRKEGFLTCKGLVTLVHYLGTISILTWKCQITYDVWFCNEIKMKHFRALWNWFLLTA